jgi:hypothetical protein
MTIRFWFLNDHAQKVLMRDKTGKVITKVSHLRSRAWVLLYTEGVSFPINALSEQEQQNGVVYRMVLEVAPGHLLVFLFFNRDFRQSTIMKTFGCQYAYTPINETFSKLCRIGRVPQRAYDLRGWENMVHKPIFEGDAKFSDEEGRVHLLVQIVQHLRMCDTCLDSRQHLYTKDCWMKSPRITTMKEQRVYTFDPTAPLLKFFDDRPEMHHFFETGNLPNPSKVHRGQKRKL